jgi:ribosomal protein S18 acetylase RimI-like enzyme
MDIREATPADREKTVALWHAAGLVVDYNPPDADFDRAVAVPQSAVLLGEIDGALVASCMVCDDGHRGWVYYVSVDPTCAREGIGSNIMDAAAEWLKASGVRKAMLMVRPTNTKVLGFYDGIGWEAEERSLFIKWVSPKYPENQDA